MLPISHRYSDEESQRILLHDHSFSDENSFSIDESDLLAADGATHFAPSINASTNSHSQSESAAVTKYTIVYKDELIHVDTTDWRNSNLLKHQILTSYTIFLLFGMGEQAVGTLIPTLGEYYGIGESKVALIFLGTVSGYFIMAITNEYAHSLLGLRGVNTLGCCAMMIGYLGVSFAPPFPILVFFHCFVGLGFGCSDASFNSWMGKLVDSNQLLGILHGFYGVGSMICPSLLSNLLGRGMFWSHFYRILLCIATIALINVIISFKFETKSKYEYSNHITHDGNNNPSESDSKPISVTETLRSKVVWTFAILLFIYVGAEVAFGSWLITYLIKVKHGEFVLMSYMGSVYWGGLTCGRMFLGFLTARLHSEIVANIIYTLMASTCTFVFWLVPSIFWLAPIVFTTGLFVGPIFPASIVIAVKILPVKYHVSGIGFACAFGGSGGAVFPFLIGFIAESESGLYYYPVVCSLLFFIVFIFWIALGNKYGSAKS